LKKIVILQIPNSKNNGSAMMAINTIHFYNTFFKNNCEFHCDFSTTNDYKRIKSELTENTALISLNIETPVKGKNSFFTLINRLKHIKKIKNKLKGIKPDAVIVLGGDDFSEYYSGWKIIIRLYYIFELTKLFPVFLLGHTIGPFYSWRKKAFNILMSKAKILTRDEPSYKYCKEELKVANIQLGHDLAWLDLPNQSNDIDIVKKYNLIENKFMVIIPSALVNQYTSNENHFFDSWAKLIHLLEEKKYKIVLMPHVFKMNKKDDIWAINEIEKRVGKKESSITFIKDELLPSECRKLLSQSIFSISCRMHSAVSTLQTGKPTIAISYSAKYGGVIGSDVNLPQLIIEAVNDTLWENNIHIKILEKINLIENNYEELTNFIKNRINEIKEEQLELMNNYGEIILNQKGNPFES